MALEVWCLVNGQSSSEAFSVDADASTSIGRLKELIKSENPEAFENVDADELKLWCAYISWDPPNTIKLDEPPVEDTLSNPRTKLESVYPQRQGYNDCIIVQPPQSAAHTLGSPHPRTLPSTPLGVMDVVKDLQGVLEPRGQMSSSAPLLRNSMPWQEPRESMEEAITTVAANVATYMARGGAWPSKADGSFLVCSGAPGVGKTRYGYELYEALQRRLPDETKKRGVDFSPNYYHMVLDFSTDIELGPDDTDLSSEIILGLRMSYYHFFRGKYEGGYQEFYRRVSKYKNVFTLNSVISAIRHDFIANLQPSDEQPSNKQKHLFLFLHIDDFQRIFQHPWRENPVGVHRDVSLDDAGTDSRDRYNLGGLRLFRDMTRKLGRFLLGETFPTMVQTFFSGTARQSVTKAAEPNSYGFQFLRCPPLSIGARYDIMSHFASEANVPHQKWMPKRGFFHLLSASGGLPRALQFVLEEFFGRQLEKYQTFEKTAREIDENMNLIFNKIANRLDNAYFITAFASAHSELVRSLIRLCILEEPSPRTLAPFDQFTSLTLETLERDTHTILEDCSDSRGKVFVRIPFFFLHIYNTVIGEVRSNLGSAFVHDWGKDREWGFFESIIAEYEVIRTNFLIGNGSQEATLKNIYKGALGRADTLNITVQLKELSLVKATNQFPKSVLTVDGKARGWKSGVVVKNADGASFADVFVYRENADAKSPGILCALQAKKVVKFPVNTLTQEHSKNTMAIENVPEGSLLDEDGIKRARTITVIITTADADSALQNFDETFPEDCLLIHRGNFAEFFGEAFSVTAAFAATGDCNVNFMTPEHLKKKHKLDDMVVDQVMKNMPYRSYDDLVSRVPAMGSMQRTEMEFLPYEELERTRKRPRVL